MPNSIQLPENLTLAKTVLENQHEIEKTNTEIGFLGKIWGTASSVPNNLPALTIIILILVGCFLSFLLKDFTYIKVLCDDFLNIIR